MIPSAAESGTPCRNSGSLGNPLPEQTQLPCITTIVDFKLRRAQLLIFHELSDALAQLRLRPAEFSVLAMIAKHPGQKQTTIAEGLGIKRANFVFLMDGIEARGLAERRKGNTDRRSHSLHLTEQGREFVARMTDIWREHENKLVDRLGGHENLNTLNDLLDRLIGTEGNAKAIPLDDLT